MSALLRRRARSITAASLDAHRGVGASGPLIRAQRRRSGGVRRTRLCSIQRASLCSSIGGLSCIDGDEAAVGCICKQSMLAETAIYAAGKRQAKLDFWWKTRALGSYFALPGGRTHITGRTFSGG